MSRLPVRKTYKLYIGGAFPRSESGRTYDAEGQNVARGSRKDVRDAVRAARGAQPGWAAATAYNRGQVIYRLAEMIEARAAEFAELSSGRDEVERSIDRIVWYAGWADKLPQVLGGSNPVAGPYFNFTVPEPTGVVAVLAPNEPPLLGLVARLLPPLVGGNAVVVVASETRPLAAIELAEAIATMAFPPTAAGASRETTPSSGDSSGASNPTTPVGSGTVKLKYGPATGFDVPSTCASLSAQPAYQTTRSIERSTSLGPEQKSVNSARRASIISAIR